MPIERHYVFRGNAVGLTVRIRRPQELNPSERASVSLSSIGGKKSVKAGSAIRRPFFLPKALWVANKLTPYVRFDQASAHVEGDFADLDQARAVSRHEQRADTLRAITNVSAEVSGLEVLHRLRVGVVRAGLVSDTKKENAETAVMLSDVALQKVFIDGRELGITLADTFFSENTTRDKVVAAYRRAQNNTPPVFCAADDEKQPAVPDRAGNVYCTIVQNMEWVKGAPRGAHIDGHSVVIDDFGTVYFGELLISHSARRLRMVRVVLGSPIGGALCAGDVETNGTFWPA